MSINERYSLFPIVDKKAYEFFKIQECAIWSSNEIDFRDDKSDYNSLSPKRQRILDKVLSFFLPGDGMVNKNIILNFLKECESAEEVSAFVAQMYIEVVHAETYGMMFYTLYDDKKIKKLQQEADESPYMKAKFDFMEKWIYCDRPITERLLAFACVEGIFFSVLFAIIFWFRKMGLMKTVVFANALIAADESLHRNYGGHLHQKRGGLKVDRALEIVNEVFEIESKFIEYLLSDTEGEEEELEDLSVDGLKEYLKVVTDSLLHCAGYDTIYNVENPLKWLDEIALIQKNNFFEVKGANYTRMSVSDALNYNKRAGREEGNENAFVNPDLVDF